MSYSRESLHINANIVGVQWKDLNVYNNYRKAMFDSLDGYKNSEEYAADCKAIEEEKRKYIEKMKSIQRETIILFFIIMCGLILVAVIGQSLLA